MAECGNQQQNLELHFVLSTCLRSKVNVRLRP